MAMFLPRQYRAPVENGENARLSRMSSGREYHRSGMNSFGCTHIDSTAIMSEKRPGNDSKMSDVAVDRTTAHTYFCGERISDMLLSLPVGSAHRQSTFHSGQ